ncbi:hypothetical protein LCGC14_1103570 [marine sediment metagenome]|uniref:Uncharacterized protein n=1 Tax=marine sediment metagenome TaxID=412755 RepID=A0A0F9M8U1_9ZZZZ
MPQRTPHAQQQRLHLARNAHRRQRASRIIIHHSKKHGAFAQIGCRYYRLTDASYQRLRTLCHATMQGITAEILYF